MRRRALVMGSAGLVAALLVAACSHNGSAKSAGVILGGTTNGAAAAGSGAIQGGSGSPAFAANLPGTSSKDATGGPVSQLSFGGPPLIRTAEMSVSTADVSAQANSAEQIALHAGGSVDSDDRTSGQHATATLTLRVPPSSLDDVMNRLAALRHEESRQLSTKDVTTTVADVNSRVLSATGAIGQLRTLYVKADKVSDIIAIETQLTQREADLESLQAQQRALSEQISMATVTLVLIKTTVPAAVRQHSSTHGFGGGLKRGWHALTGSAAVLFAGFGAVLPFGVVLALAAASWLLVRRRRPRQSAPVSEAP